MPIIKLDVGDAAPVDIFTLISEFKREIINYGFELKEFGERAKIHRCTSRASGKRKQDVGWYIYYITDAGLVCRYGDWIVGETKSFERISIGHTNQELQELRRLIAEQEHINKIEIEQIAANQAAEIANSCVVRDHHPYLVKKQLNGLVDVLVSSDLIIIPIIDEFNYIKSVQYIFPDGQKRYLKGGRVKGCFSLVGIKFDDLKLIKTIGIAEGYATALTVHKFIQSPVVMAHTCSKIKEVTEILLKYPNLEKIIIYADNDHKTNGNPGLTAAFEAQKLSKKIMVMHPHGLEGTDFNDLFCERGEAELKTQLGIVENQRLFKRLGELKIKPPEYLIDNILQKNSVGVIYGAPGHGKTHVALSMAVACAANIPWYKSNVNNKDGGVLYICGEDLEGVSRRCYAIAAELEIDNINKLNFYVTENAIHFLDPNAVHKVKEEIKILPQKPALIIIDTLNRNMGDGDENSTQHMTKFYDAVDSLRIETGCTILLVHHSSKDDPTKMRGSTVIIGGVHTGILVNSSVENSEENGVFLGKVINVTCPKQKGAKEFDKLVFKLDTNLYGPYLTMVGGLVPILFGNSPSKSPAYKLVIQSLKIHTTLKNNLIALDELMMIFSQCKVDKLSDRLFLDELIKNEVLNITPQINKFELRA